MAPALKQENSHTIDDIYNLPEGSRAELIDGHIMRGFFSPFAVFLNEDDTNYVEPDISVICDPHKLNDKGCIGAPDWITEIVSPGSRRMDYFTKLFKYRTAGVREYWIVDPEKNRILVYNFESEDTGDYTFADSVKTGIYDDLLINFSEIADLLKILPKKKGMCFPAYAFPTTRRYDLFFYTLLLFCF